MTKIRLTKIEGREKTGRKGIAIGESVEGELDEEAIIKAGNNVPLKPTVGQSFFISTYKTGRVEEILTDSTFRTSNSVYMWEKL